MNKNMNKKQLTVLWIGITVFALMGLYPPWVLTERDSIAGFWRLGYSFILNEPGTPKFCRLDTSRLGVQWVIVAAITTGLVVTLKDKKPKDEPKQ